MGTCRLCGQTKVTISNRIGYCASCLRRYWPEIKSEIEEIHRKTRSPFGLPEEPPKAKGGLSCHLCFHRCQIPEGAFGYCGVWQNQAGRLVGASSQKAYVSWYLDPLPTNCVADFVCPGGTGAGYPEYAYRPGPERGYANLAVFYEACNFNCLYCQNWSFKKRPLGQPGIAGDSLFKDLVSHVSCICYFGGDPGPQSPHALWFSRQARRRHRDRILRICWETNGAENQAVIKEMMSLSLESGGCVKIDLKAFSEPIHLSLCGVSNRQTLENFSFLAGFIETRPEPPPLIASTLLVPGYVDEEELTQLAKFIASLNPDIPWSLLAFYPCFYLDDLPTTSRRHAEMALSIAKSAGLKRVNLGNRHLLGEAY